jgi:uncharacterized repeat protein (TIGR01451 family)
MQKLVGGKDTVINVYYTTNSYEYKVEHYYDGEIDPSRTDTSSALYGSEVDKNTLTLKPKNGYEFEKTENCPLTIGTDESKNVIKVYYKKKADLSYTVKYLEKGTNKKLHNEKTVENQTFGAEITSASEKIDIDGYNYDSVEPEEKLTIGTGENVITFYYTKRTDLSYTVKYLEKGTNKKLHNEKTVENQTFGAEITSASEKIDIDGYNYDSVEPEEKLTIGTGENVITFYYTKRNDLSYTVNYLEKDTLNVLHNPKVQDGMTFDEVVNSADEVIEINGYNYDSVVPEETLTIGTGENVITFYYTKRTDLSYTVNYLEKDTLNVLHNPKVQDGMTFDEVVNSADEVIEINGYNYDSVVPEETLTIGTGENVINIYYTKRNDLSYTVNYLEKDTLNVLHNPKVQDGMTFDEVVNSADEVIEINGYNYDSVVPEETLTIGTGENVINIYYTKRNDLSYTVNYLEKDTLNVLHNPKGQDGMTFDEVVNSADEVIEINGYNYDSVVPEETLTIGTGENVINIYYTKRNDLSYTVNYLEKDTLNVLHNPKVQDGMTFDEVVNSADEVIEINGYNYDSVDKDTLTIGTSDNVINIYYTKKTGLSYTVNYYWNGTTEKVAESKTVNDQTFEAEVTEHPVEAEGYTPVSTDPKTITIDADSTKNVITFYYYKNVTLEANSATATYDGTPKSVSGYDCSVDGLTFEGITAGATGTLVGEYPATFNTNPEDPEFPKKQLDTTGNYIVAAVVPGLLTITDDPVDDANVITKKHGTEIDTDTAQSLYNLGETVTFTISVKNIYNTPKTITLTEKANVKFSNGENVIVFKDVPAGETVTAEATYTITSEDILEGVFRNTVTATFGDDKSWEARDEVETAKLDTTLNVTKTSGVPDGQKAALGQTITYTIKVQNAGNVPYTNVKVEDPLTGLTETIETLAVGETKTFTTEYVVTEADVLEGHVLNTATAKGDKIKDPKGDEPKEPNGGDEVETPTFAPITIKPKDVTATYNGAAITGKDVEITSGKLLEGHKLTAAVIGSGVNAGSYELTLDPEKIKIVDANNKDVSEMYARTILPGKLIINKRSVLISSQSATKTYDGSALTRPAVTITGDGFVPGELAKAEATGSITKVGSTPNAIRYTTTGAFNAANYSIALSVGTLTVTEKPKPEPRRTFNLTINYVYQNGKRAAASYNRGGLKNGETFDITSPVIAGYTASETVVSGTIYNRDIKVTVIYTADGVNLDDYGVPLGLGNITMNVGDCFE